MIFAAGRTIPTWKRSIRISRLGSQAFFAGNRYFVTKRLWNVGSIPNHFHHGEFTTIRESIMAHAGEARSSQSNFANLIPYDQGSIIEFLKTLKVLPAGTRSLVVDEHKRPIEWPPTGLH